MNEDTSKFSESERPIGRAALETDLSGQISSWRDFSDLVSEVVAMAVQEPGPIVLSDRNFEHWPLGQRAVVDAFQQWAMSSAREIRCSLLAGNFDGFILKHPRWLNWRKLWAHRVLCRQAPEELFFSVPTILALPGKIGLRVVEPLVGRGLWTRDPTVIGDWLSEVYVILQQSSEGMPTTTLGL